MTPPLEEPVPVDYRFSSTIGVKVKGDLWSAITVPESKEVFGSLRSVRVDAKVDDILIENIGLMPTGSGELMLSISAVVRKKLAKNVGDEVDVVILRRLT